MTLFTSYNLEPLFTNDAIVAGVLMTVLALIFYTASLDVPFWKKFYNYIPALLLAYFVPAILNWPLGIISPEWYSNDLFAFLGEKGISLPEGMNFHGVTEYLKEQDISKGELSQFQHKSNLYFVASRYFLPASLVLFCLSIDIKGLVKLGPKALIMFFAATLGIILGGPIALLLTSSILPDLIQADPSEIWRGLSTVAGSWIGGGANQTAMKEIFNVSDNLFGTMIVVDVVVANIWMGFLLYGANISPKIDKWLKADSSAIEELKQRVADYRASIEKMPTKTSVFILMGFAFGGVALAHLGAEFFTPLMESMADTLKAWRLDSLLSSFFWLIIVATLFGLALSFTKARELEGVGASRWGSVFIYILVATIGMKMNLGEVLDNLGLFLIGIIWMLVHVIILLIVAKIIKAPFFFVAVGSQANVGGAASAPVVASAFDDALAPVGVLMAVLGYGIGTIGAIGCATLMQIVSGG
jgi:uncharacterized membrane protein